MHTEPDWKKSLKQPHCFNKIDRVDSKTLAQAQQVYPDAVFISAIQRLGLDTLRQRLLHLIDSKKGNTGNVNKTLINQKGS